MQSVCIVHPVGAVRDATILRSELLQRFQGVLRRYREELLRVDREFGPELEQLALALASLPQGFDDTALVQRELEEEAGTDAACAVDADSPTMRLDDLLADVEAKARAGVPRS